MHYQRVDRTLKYYARSPRRQYFQITFSKEKTKNQNNKPHMQLSIESGLARHIFFVARLQWG